MLLLDTLFSSGPAHLSSLSMCGAQLTHNRYQTVAKLRLSAKWGPLEEEEEARLAVAWSRQGSLVPRWTWPGQEPFSLSSAVSRIDPPPPKRRTAKLPKSAACWPRSLAYPP